MTLEWQGFFIGVAFGLIFGAVIGAALMQWAMTKSNMGRR